MLSFAYTCTCFGWWLGVSYKLQLKLYKESDLLLCISMPFCVDDEVKEITLKLVFVKNIYILQWLFIFMRKCYIENSKGRSRFHLCSGGRVAVPLKFSWCLCPWACNIELIISVIQHWEIHNKKNVHATGFSIFFTIVVVMDSWMLDKYAGAG